MRPSSSVGPCGHGGWRADKRHVVQYSTTDRDQGASACASAPCPAITAVLPRLPPSSLTTLGSRRSRPCVANGSWAPTSRVSFDDTVSSDVSVAVPVRSDSSVGRTSTPASGSCDGTAIAGGKRGAPGCGLGHRLSPGEPPLVGPCQIRHGEGGRTLHPMPRDAVAPTLAPGLAKAEGAVGGRGMASAHPDTGGCRECRLC